MTLTLPTVHLNGTSREMLASGYHEAYRKLIEFRDAFASVEFNARDYYVQGPAPFSSSLAVVSTMAELKSFFVRSRSEGKTWKVYSHKPQGRPAVVSACEGELEATDTPGVTFFRTILFGDRRATVTVAGRATKRALYEAAQELLRQMIDAGYIYADDVEPLVSKLYVA